MRTTNIIEQIKKKFGCGTKTMEILAGEMACYRILFNITLKMEPHWRSNSLGKVRKSLPFFKGLVYGCFTKNIRLGAFTIGRLESQGNFVIRFTGRDGLKTGGKGLGVEVGGSRRQQEDREKNPQSLRDL